MLSGPPEPGRGAGPEGRWVSSRATCGCQMKAPRAPQSESRCPPRGRGQRPISVRMCLRPLFPSRARGEGVRPCRTTSPGCSRRPLCGARPAGPVTAAAGVPVAGTRPVLRRAGAVQGRGAAVGGRSSCPGSPWVTGRVSNIESFCSGLKDIGSGLWLPPHVPLERKRGLGPGCS